MIAEAGKEFPAERTGACLPFSLDVVLNVPVCRLVIGAVQVVHLGEQLLERKRNSVLRVEVERSGVHASRPELGRLVLRKLAEAGHVKEESVTEPVVPHVDLAVAETTADPHPLPTGVPVARRAKMQGPQHRVLRVVDYTPQLVRPHCASGNECAGDIDERDVHRLLKLREDIASELVLIVDAASRLADLEKSPERRAKAHSVHGCAVGTDDGCHDTPVRDVADEPLELLLRLRGEFPAELHGSHRERVDEVVLRGPTGHLGRLVGDVRDRVGHERIVDVGEADSLVAVHTVHDVDLDAVARVAVSVDVVGPGTEELPNRAASGA